MQDHDTCKDKILDAQSLAKILKQDHVAAKADRIVTPVMQKLEELSSDGFSFAVF